MHENPKEASYFEILKSKKENLLQSLGTYLISPLEQGKVGDGTGIRARPASPAKTPTTWNVSPKHPFPKPTTPASQPRRTIITYGRSANINNSTHHSHQDWKLKQTRHLCYRCQFVCDIRRIPVTGPGLITVWSACRCCCRCTHAPVQCRWRP